MHPRQRKIAIVLLGLGTLVGFGSGFASMRNRACARREAFEQRVAEVCVDAARRVDRDEEAALEEPTAKDREERGHRGRGHKGRGHDRHHGSDNLR